MTWVELLLAGSLCASRTPAPACSCLLGPPLTTRRAVAETVAAFDAVFEGVVVASTVELDSAVRGPGEPPYRWRELRATVAVSRRWKGAPADTVVVTTPLQGTMCGVDFAEGGRYLIFASDDGPRGLGTTSCTPTVAWGREAKRLSRLLGPPAPRR